MKAVALAITLAVLTVLAQSNDSVPLNYGIVVFPAFQALDVFGPLDALNMLSFAYPLNLSIIAATLDPITTKPQTNLVNSNFSESIAALAHGPQTLTPPLIISLLLCTGATLAARAGVLDGKNATTNKKSWEWATSQGPNVNWISHARWVVDGNIYTTSGVSAGIDGTFAFMEAVYGANATETVANSMEYVRETNSSWDPFAELYGL
ncbi:class I glutamine amidotransferase-like protein [Armillaria novae-zelandiae]|uniref:Class I glutamine amidotransferase-like protein n=1 Tax=Armillaria novae-zelandiae TaxID=153914 RepID=A0AA39NEI1_9AGAR|nr:class I glutamine amidotransferase-like protein [Armillaria novae-zelandiae]